MSATVTALLTAGSEVPLPKMIATVGVLLASNVKRHTEVFKA